MSSGRNNILCFVRNKWCYYFFFLLIVNTSISLVSSQIDGFSSNVYPSNIPKKQLTPVPMIPKKSVAIIPTSSSAMFSETSNPPLDPLCLDEDRNSFCVPLCCHWNQRLEKNKCVMSNVTAKFPPVHDGETLTLTDLVIDETNFRFFVRDPCNGSQKFKLTPEEYDDDDFLFLQNGSIYLMALEKTVDVMDYCFGVTDQKQYDVIMCFEGESDPNDSKNEIKIFFPIGLFISVPFLMVTFIIYTILPELKNMHGRTLRGYIGCLIIAYTILAIAQTTPSENISDTICVLIAFVIHYSFLASFFWLNIMCFDIWWTFSGFRAMSGSVQQRDRKKFIMYSIYAWGSASVFTGLCLIMDFSPNLPKDFIRPKFGTESCWFNDNTARAIYFYGPMAITVLCNIFLFISTAVKIQQHKRDTAHHLKGSESRRHDDNKQWFNLYLKLFIVMGINWSMEIVSWLCDGSPEYVWYITDLANTLQGVIIFIIFVCKDKIKRLLLRRFGCQDRNILSRYSTRSVYQSSTSRTCITSTSGVPLRENANTYIRREPICTTKESAEESDCA